MRSHGGFSFLRHNEIRDFTAKLFTEMCSNVRIEAELQPLTGKSLSYTSANRQDSARLDIRAQGFGGEWQQDAFFDVRVFNPTHLATATLPQKPATGSKKRGKEGPTTSESERLNEAPLLPWCSLLRRHEPAARTVYKRLARLISEKTVQPYSITTGWIQCCLSFSLLRTAILYIRGSWSSYHHPICPSEGPINVITSEGRASTIGSKLSTITWLYSLILVYAHYFNIDLSHHLHQ